MSTRSSRRIASRREDATEEQDKDGVPAESGQQHASTAPEGYRGEETDEGPGARQRRSRPPRRRKPEAQRAEQGQRGLAQEERLHSSAGPSDAQAAQALAGLHGDFAGQHLEPAEAEAEMAPTSAAAGARSAGQAKRVPPRSPPKPGRPPLPAELLRPQLDSMHGLHALPVVPPASVPYPSLEALASIAEGIGTSGGGEAVDTDEGDLASQQGKRRAAPDEAEEGLSETEGEGGSGDSRRAEGRHKRPRLVWTAELHARFMNAVNHLGVKNAVPKTILQLMNVEGMTRENVASHLQKYRLYLKRMAGYPPAARLPLDTLQQVQQAIQQQGHPPLFQQNAGGISAAVGIGFPGYLPASSGMGSAAAPHWRPPVAPMSSEGAHASEAGPVMQPFPWLGAPFPGPGGFQSGMGMYGQVPAAFNPSGPEGGTPPGYGWFWGMMGGPGAAGVPAGPPVQGQRAPAGTGQRMPTTAPQGTPHAPLLTQAGVVDRQSEPKSAQAVPSQGGTAAFPSAHGADSGEARKAALPEDVQPKLHGLHAVQDHSSAEHHPGASLQGDSQAGLVGTPAGQAAHTLPATGQPAHTLPLPAHTSAAPSAQAHAASPHMRPPDEGGTAVPAVPSGAAPEGRLDHQPEQPRGLTGQDSQHAHQTAGLGQSQEAPCDAQLEATQEPPPHGVS